MTTSNWLLNLTEKEFLKEVKQTQLELFMRNFKFPCDGCGKMLANRNQTYRVDDDDYGLRTLCQNCYIKQYRCDWERTSDLIEKPETQTVLIKREIDQILIPELDVIIMNYHGRSDFDRCMDIIKKEQRCFKAGGCLVPKTKRALGFPERLITIKHEYDKCDQHHISFYAGKILRGEYHENYLFIEQIDWSLSKIDPWPYFNIFDFKQIYPNWKFKKIVPKVKCHKVTPKVTKLS